MTGEHRSGCPISLTLELLGDRWSLLILRDIMFANRRTFRELLGSEEHIASNILTERLRRMVAAGLLSASADEHHRQKVVYRLTESSIDLVPLMVQLGAWGSHHLDADPLLTVPSRVLSAGGPRTWERFAEELRAEHLDRAMPVRRGPSVHAQIERAINEFARAG